MMEAQGAWRELWEQFAENLEHGWSWSGFERSAMFLNDGSANFVDISTVTGLDQVTDGRGVAIGDIDNDGDVDMICTSSRTTPHVYVLRNDLVSDRHHALVELHPSGNRSAAGAKILLTAGGKTQRRDVAVGYGYRAQHDLAQHFGLGDTGRVERIEITWPDGTHQVLENQRADCRLIVKQDEAEVRIVEHAPRNFNATGRLHPKEWHDHWNRMRLLEKPYINLAGLNLPSLEDGTQVRLATGSRYFAETGKATLLNLWATWCVNCAREMPDLVAAHSAPDSAVRVVALAMDEGAKRADVAKVAKAWGMEFPVSYTLGPDRVALMAALEPLLGESKGLALPTSLLLDFEGNVRGIVQGAIDIETVEMYLNFLRAPR